LGFNSIKQLKFSLMLPTGNS